LDSCFLVGEVVRSGSRRVATSIVEPPRLANRDRFRSSHADQRTCVELAFFTDRASGQSGRAYEFGPRDGGIVWCPAWRIGSSSSGAARRDDIGATRTLLASCAFFQAAGENGFMGQALASRGRCPTGEL